MTKFGYLKEDIVYRLEQNGVTLDDLYERKLDEAARFINPVYRDEMYKFLGHLPNIEFEVTA